MRLQSAGDMTAPGRTRGQPTAAVRHTMRRTFGAGDEFYGFGRDGMRETRESRDVRDNRENFDNGNGMVPPPTPSTGVRLPPTGSNVPAFNSGVRSTVGAHTLCNHGKSPENQDSFVASSNMNGTKCLVGVFDGHGEQGKKVSEFSRTHIAKALFNHKDLHSNPAAALEGACLDAQRAIERSHTFDAFHSGTTAVAAYLHHDRLVIANVGDSRAVLGCSDSNSHDASNSQGLKAVDLTHDQRPSREDEKRRILAEGGNIHQSSIPVRQSPGGPTVLVRVGPERVWDRTGRCGLCVTRSLGDLSMHPFVTAQPEMSERVLSSKDKVLILGSDGVWDRIGSQEAVDIASRHRDPAAAAREIVSIAKQRWHAETQGRLSDDITAVVMHLDHSSEPPTRGISTPAIAPSRPITSQQLAQRPMSGTDPGLMPMVGRPDPMPAPQKRIGNQKLAALDSLRSMTGDRLGLGSTAPLGRRKH